MKAGIFSTKTAALSSAGTLLNFVNPVSDDDATE